MITVKGEGYYPNTIVQIVTKEITTEASTAVSLPIDDTIPQNTEGAEYTTLAITPINTANKILINFTCWGGCSSTDLWGAALFKDSDADALSAVAVEDNGKQLDMAVLAHIDSPATVSEVTYKIRYGSHSGAKTLYLLRSASSSLFSTAKKAVFTLVEYTT